MYKSLQIFSLIFFFGKYSEKYKIITQIGLEKII